MKKQSLTITSLVVGIIAVILSKIGVQVGGEALTTTVLTIVQIISAIGVYVGRYRKGDISIVGRKK